MAFVNSPENLNGLFSSTQNNLNFDAKSSNDLNTLIKSLNIVNPDDLSKEDISLILKRIDDYEGLFSTQQLENIDYKNFKNHVFFDSAVNKLTSSFERIQQIPYDKDELENIKFFNKSDGYTKYILNSLYPKSKGYVKFNGNTALAVFDEQGKILNDTKNKEIGLLNPTRFRFSFDFWLKPESVGFAQNQVVFKKIQIANNSIKNGYICYLNESGGNYYLNFKSIVDNVAYNSKTKITLDAWHNIVINVNIDKKVSFIIGGENVLESDIVKDTINSIKKKAFPLEFKSKNIPFSLGGMFYINSGNIQNTLTDNENIVYTNLTGSIDEFRMFFKFRSRNTIKKEMHKNIYAQKGLMLYLRLNEPAGNYTNSCLTIDYSGNKLHGLIYDISLPNIALLTNTSNIKINQEQDTSWHLNLEKKEDSPVLNSAYINITTLRENLINLAKDYDNNNPNLIFNMLPKHYFLNSSDFQNLPVYSSDDAYTSGLQITANDLQITASQLNASLPANSELVNIVLIWAKFFDKLKMYIGSITNLLNVDYDSFNNKNVIAMQIPILCKMYGFDFKEIFPTISKSKLDNLNLNYDDIVSEYSIRKIQNLLWQRFLINTQDFLKSKGTIRSIESTFNSFGIDYKKLIDIKEYSYSNTITQEKNFYLETIDTFSINFGNITSLTSSGNFSNVVEGPSNNKLLLEVPNIRSKQTDQRLVADTIEKGLGKNDWSIELFFNFNDSVNKKRFINQSKLNQINSPDFYYDNVQYLFYLDSGVEDVNDDGVVIFAKYERINSFNSKLGTITIEIQPIAGGNFNRTISLENVNIFDVTKHLVLTQKREDNKLTYKATLNDVGQQVLLKSAISKESSITITGDDLDTRISNNEYLFSNVNNNLNLKVGDYKYSTLNNLNSTASNNLIFEGEVLKIRLWKHCLVEEEIKSHARNIKNFSKKNNVPLKTLILDTEVKNIERSLDANDNFYKWNVEDISVNSVLNSLEIESLNTCIVKTKNVVQTDKLVIKNNSLICKVFNPKLDEITSSNKVNILSYKEEDNKKNLNNFTSFPSNEIHSHYEYDSVNRVSIDMSIVKSINEDISKIITDMNDFSSKMSNCMSKYEYQYKDINDLREDYFSKYSDSDYINYASVGNIFKYFDNIMSSILYDIVPSRVRFEGFNFVYESHALERHKYQHKNKDSINTIISHEQRFDFSRNSILSRRSNQYNVNRTRE